MTPIDHLAHRIAYSAARSDIECFCQFRGTDATGRRYFDTNDITDRDPSIIDDVTRSTNYLEQRGKLISHRTYAAWVTFKPDDDHVDNHADTHVAPRAENLPEEVAA